MQNSSVILLILGTITTVVYLWYNQPYEERNGSAVNNTGLANNDLPEPRALFTIQYEQINERVRSRENVTVVVGSLFVTASFLLMSSSVDLPPGSNLVLKDMLVLASLALYSIWLLAFSLPANKLSSRELCRLRQMEAYADYRINVHTYLWENVRNKGWYRYLRRQIWVFPFWVLVAAAVLIMEIA